LALIGIHLALVWFQKHTQFPGPGRTEKNVVGVRVMPVFAVKSGAFFAMTVGILGLMGGLLQINPIWQLGPYKPSQVSAGSQPDFYMMWTEGLARIWPPWEFYPFGHTIPAVVWVALGMGLVFTLLIVYPWIEKKLTGDYAHHNLLQRPRDVPVRTAIGAMAISFYMVLTLAAMNDIIAWKFHISLNATTWIARIGMVVLPAIVYYIAYRWCVGLQRSDRAVLEHGIETGIIKRLPHGAYIELHQPLGPVDEHGHPIPLEYQGAAVPKRLNKLGSAGKPGTGSLLYADPASDHEALTAVAHGAERKALNALQALDLGERAVVPHSTIDSPPDDQRHQHAVERPRREAEGPAVRREHLKTVPLRTEHRTPSPLRWAVAAQRSSFELGADVMGKQPIGPIAGRGPKRIGRRDVADCEYGRMTGNP
jgi:quinol---cytochrome-c reductase cytochrome b subunit